MAGLISYLELLLMVICVFLLCYRRARKGSPLTNWPVVGMLPGLLANTNNHFLDFVTDILRRSDNTFVFKGPWFSNMNMIVTCDPANVNYVLSKNFSNFGKGPEFEKIFDILGDGIFNSDSQKWENQRRMAVSLLKHPSFEKFLTVTTWNNVQKGLIPVLDHVAEMGAELDLQALFDRLTFDNICVLILGHDPAGISIDLPHGSIEKTLAEAEEALLLRHILPEWFWKLQRWLQIGKEKKLAEGIHAVGQLVSRSISSKREALSRIRSQTAEDEGDGFDLLTAYMKALEGEGGELANSEKLLRDTLLNFFFAGRDTISAALTWFFWLIATNPLQENKIREEIKANLHVKEDGTWSAQNTDELNNLTYLHGALCESLRLFPPVSLQHRAPHQSDILPSGHQVSRNTKTLISFYSMARMENIWGEDCLEFRPERWVSERGRIKHVPSYKFVTFNAGPRKCIGKEMALIQLKIVAAFVIYNYHIQVMEGHPVSPSASVILHMKHGLKGRVTKRKCV